MRLLLPRWAHLENWRITPALPGERSFSGLELSSFERLMRRRRSQQHAFRSASQAGDIPAADQQRSEICKPAACDKALIQF
jgi:hypothetical protein